MIPGFHYGYAVDQDSMWCIQQDSIVARMLCGARVRFVPVVQPVLPSNVHGACVEAMAALGPQPVPPQVPDEGVCPVCGGSAALLAGVVRRHGAWRVRGGEPYVSADRCAGEGQRPDVSV